MAIRKWTVAGGACARRRSRRRVGRLGRSRASPRQHRQGRARHRHRQPQRPRLQRSGRPRASSGPRPSSASRAASSSRSRPATTSRTCRRRRARATTSSSAIGFLIGDQLAARREAVPERRTSRSSTSRGPALEGQADERPRPPLRRAARPAASSACSRRRCREQGAARVSVGRRPGRSRRVDVRSRATRRARRSRSRASRCSSATRRTSSTRRSARSWP